LARCGANFSRGRWTRPSRKPPQCQENSKAARFNGQCQIFALASADTPPPHLKCSKTVRARRGGLVGLMKKLFGCARGFSTRGPVQSLWRRAMSLGKLAGSTEAFDLSRACVRRVFWRGLARMPYAFRPLRFAGKRRRAPCLKLGEAAFAIEARSLAARLQLMIGLRKSARLEGFKNSCLRGGARYKKGCTPAEGSASLRFSKEFFIKAPQHRSTGVAWRRSPRGAFFAAWQRGAPPLS
jgi:hypothetical protein